jgi:hypothetical protein
MKPQGSLAERDFPELIHDLHRNRWTGTLTLTHIGVGRSVMVQEGRLVFASSSSPDDRLGELLLRRGRLTLRQFADAGRAVGPGKRLGAVLVEQGILAPKDLVKMVVDHTQEIIYGAFLWTEGQYRLQDGLDAAEAITLKISTPDLIIEGIRRIDAWSRLNRAVGDLTARYYEDVIGNMTISFEKLSLLTSLNEPADVETICRESALSDFETCRTLWAFRVIGVVRRLDAPQRAAPTVLDEGLDLVLPGE